MHDSFFELLTHKEFKAIIKENPTTSPARPINKNFFLLLDLDIIIMRLKKYLS